ncbi:hypothetical protein GQR58_026316 [Nymphon striatum]|nr:hypothetical protein GQR58_026316 [Nymphon striatum]
MAVPLPPSYSAATHQHASVQPGLTYRDFIPNCVDAGGVFSRPTFEPFGVLMQRANEFLNGNPGVQVKTCESVEFKFGQGGLPKLHKLTYIESGKHLNLYLRGLRLWLVPRDDPTRPPQQIGYFNNIPAITSQNIGTPDFESLDSVVETINNNLRNRPLQGRMLNMETQDMKFKGYSPEGMDPDKSCWQEYGERDMLFIYVLRVYYEIGDPSYELLGCVDFVPDCRDAGGVFSLPTYEPFSQVIMKASSWCYHNSTTRFCNAQTMNYKLKTEGVNTKRMHYVEHGKRLTGFLKILRVVYATPFVPLETAPPPLAMSSRTFEPVPISTGGLMGIPNYEFLEPTMNRISAWIRATVMKNYYQCSTNPMSDSPGQVHLGVPAFSPIQLGHGLMPTFRHELARYGVENIRELVEFFESLLSEEEKNAAISQWPALKTKLSRRQEAKPLDVYSSLLQSILDECARVLSAETRAERMNMDMVEGTDSGYTYNTGRGCYVKTIFRVYLDGNYQEPPPEALPPLPTTLEEDCCCKII